MLTSGTTAGKSTGSEGAIPGPRSAVYDKSSATPWKARRKKKTEDPTAVQLYLMLDNGNKHLGCSELVFTASPFPQIEICDVSFMDFTVLDSL